MKWSLLCGGVLASAVAVAAPDYENCTNNSKTEVCQAYLAGFSQGKASVDTTAMTEQEKTFRSRALEQRVGERYRKTVQDEKKPTQSTN